MASGRGRLSALSIDVGIDSALPLKSQTFILPSVKRTYIPTGKFSPPITIGRLVVMKPLSLSFVSAE
ncbi:MAG: hypothetical protein WKF84_18755 [Pyrinomonadaceae bacterium]